MLTLVLNKSFRVQDLSLIFNEYSLYFLQPFDKGLELRFPCRIVAVYKVQDTLTENN